MHRIKYRGTKSFNITGELTTSIAWSQLNFIGNCRLKMGYDIVNCSSMKAETVCFLGEGLNWLMIGRSLKLAYSWARLKLTDG